MSEGGKFSPWQQRAYRRLVASFDADRLGHGQLVCGPAGLGKREVVEKFGQYLLCERRHDGQPCGQCRSCQLCQSRSQRDPLEQRPDKSPSHPHGHPAHPDAIFIGYALNPKSSTRNMWTQIVVDQIRELTDRLFKTPQFGGNVFALIEPADALNESASNSLLKTLEEPVPGRFLFLLTANPMRLPATIRSRCQRLEFKLPLRDEALAWLREQGWPDKSAAEALDAARGHPGLADEWLRGNGLALRRQVADDLEKLQTGQGAPVEIAQRWAADEHAALRLRHAADLALARAAGLTDMTRMDKLASWFDHANRTRDLLRTTVRGDLAMVELLLVWRGLHRAASQPGERGGMA
ncbi:MAG: DNA polymerase III subunit delta' [Pseudoxanthomonas sp.]